MLHNIVKLGYFIIDIVISGRKGKIQFVIIETNNSAILGMHV